MSLARRSFFIMAAFWLASCGGRPPIVYESNLDRFDYNIVESDKYSLSVSELRQLLSESRLLPQGGLVDLNTVKLFVDSLVIDTLVGLKAEEVNIEDNFNNYHLYRLRYNDYLIKIFLNETVYDPSVLDSQAVVDMVESDPELFQVGDNVFFNQILISPLSLRISSDSVEYKAMSYDEINAVAKKLVDEIRALIISPDSFAVIAERYSHDVYSKGQGGFVGWTPRGTYFDPFDSIAFSSEIGSISEPYLDQDGWHILWVRDKIAAGVVPLDKLFSFAAANAQTIRANQLGRAISDSLSREINLEYNEAILDKNIYYLHRQERAAVLNGKDTIIVNDMRRLEEEYRRRYGVDNTGPEHKKEMLNEIAERYIMLQAARAAKMDTLPDVVAVEAGLRHKYQKISVIRSAKESGWEPSEKHIEYYYQQHLDRFVVEKPLVVQQIIVQDSLFGEFLRDQALAGVDFLGLAEEHYPGEPELRRALADLGQIGPEDVSEEFYGAAMLAPVGGVSSPVRTEFGFQIIKVLKKKSQRSFEDVRVNIFQTLQKEHADEVKEQFKQELYEQFGVKFKGRLYPVHLKPRSKRAIEPQI